jgi:archaellum component FlaF (FlaF/FlaG flagellin family)
MEHAIPALVVAAVIVFGGVILADATRGSLQTVDESWRDIEAISEERLGTDLTVASTQVTDGGSTVTVVIANEGRTSISEPSYMDLIMNYDGTDVERHVVWLPYTDTSPPGDNEWTVDSISGDYRNPGILDTGEEMTIQIHLNPPTDTGPDRWLVLSTETGVAYSIYF